MSTINNELVHCADLPLNFWALFPSTEASFPIESLVCLSRNARDDSANLLSILHVQHVPCVLDVSHILDGIPGSRERFEKLNHENSSLMFADFVFLLRECVCVFVKSFIAISVCCVCLTGKRHIQHNVLLVFVCHHQQ